MNHTGTRTLVAAALVSIIAGCGRNSPQPISTWIVQAGARSEFRIKYMNGGREAVRIHRELVDGGTQWQVRALDVYWNGERLEHIGGESVPVTEPDLSSCDDFVVIEPGSEIEITFDLATAYRYPLGSGSMTVVALWNLNFCERGADGAPGQLLADTWVGRWEVDRWVASSSRVP